MGICTCLRTNVFVNEINNLTSNMLKQSNYETLQILLTKNFSIYDKDLELFGETKDEIINTESSGCYTYEAILNTFYVGKTKVNCYDLLSFFFPLSKHEDISQDFYNLAAHYDKEESNRNIVYRENLFKLLSKIVTFHTIMIIRFVECNKINRDEYEFYEKIFTEENIAHYITHVLNNFDHKLKEKESISLINDKVYFFSLENIRECFKDYALMLTDERYLIWDFERCCEANMLIN